MPISSHCGLTTACFLKTLLTVRRGWKINEQQANKYVSEGTDGAQFLSTRSDTRDGGLRSASVQPPAGSAPSSLTPYSGENHVAVMRYGIDFLMKHNITFSLAPGFLFRHHTLPNANARGGKNQYKPGEKSQTLGNLSALDFKVWACARFT